MKKLILIALICCINHSFTLSQSNEEVLANTGFSNGTSYWFLAKYQGAQATYYHNDINNELIVIIENGSMDKKNLMLQQYFELEKFQYYELSVDVNIEQTKQVDISITTDTKEITRFKLEMSPGQENYGPFLFSSEWYDPSAKISFEIGGDEVGIVFNNISLRKARPSMVADKIFSSLPPGPGVFARIIGLSMAESIPHINNFIFPDTANFNFPISNFYLINFLTYNQISIDDIIRQSAYY